MNQKRGFVPTQDGEDGCTVLGAAPEREVEWVALTRDQVAALPDLTPVLVQRGAVVSEGLFYAVPRPSESVYLHHLDDKRLVGNLTDVTVYVHPDVADPEVALIERAAKAVYESHYTGTFHTKWDSTNEIMRDIYRRQARVALAAFREGTR